jgi:hypothetical protein
MSIKAATVLHHVVTFHSHEAAQPPISGRVKPDSWHWTLGTTLLATDDKIRGSGKKIPGSGSGSGLRQTRGRDGNDQGELAAEPSAGRTQQ